MLDKKTKDKVIAKFRTHPSDTGSPEVQIAILTEEIKLLTEHLRQHKKDFSSRRGLIKKVNQRRSLLRYLERENSESYQQLIKKLKIKPLVRYEMPIADFEEETEKGLGAEESLDEKVVTIPR